MSRATNAEANATESVVELPSLLYALKQVELGVRARMDAALCDAGITALQYTALTVLRHRDGLSTAALARNSFVTAQTMGEMLATLERRGLVTRRVDPGHRRRHLTSLTDEGRALVRDYQALMDDIEDSMVASLSLRDCEALREYLNVCRRNLSQDSHIHRRPGSAAE